MRLRLRPRGRKLALAFVLTIGLGLTALPAAPAAAQAPVKNWAGPGCPGASQGWTCQNLTPNLVQNTSGPGGVNHVECTGAACGPVVQNASNGATNEAVCSQFGRGNGNVSIGVTCNIKQVNTAGDGKNVIAVNQDVQVFKASLLGILLSQNQGSDATALLVQESDSGENRITARQIGVTWSRGAISALPVQTQNVRQLISSSQKSNSGDQFSDIDQSEDLLATATGILTVNQQQNTSPGFAGTPCTANGLGQPNSCAFVEMKTGENASNTSTVDQTQTLNQSAVGVAQVTQTQGAPTGGLGVVWDFSCPSAEGEGANITVNQSKNWTQSATGLVLQPLLGKTQVQNDALRILGLGLTTCNATTTQQTQLTADAGAQQTCTQAAEVHAEDNANSSQNCTVTNGGTTTTQTNTASGTDYTAGTQCTGGSCITTGAPDSHLHKSVINLSNEESFGDGHEGPTSTEASSSSPDNLRYRVRYHNDGTGTANDVVVTDHIPSETFSPSCHEDSDNCSLLFEPPCGECDPVAVGVRADFGDVPAGESRDLVFDVTKSEGTTEPFTNTAEGDTAEEAPFTSNGATVNPSAPPTSGSISGQVTDATSGDPIAGALVEAKQGETVVGSGSTDGSGNYSIGSLAPGNYDLTASKEGYNSATNTGVAVTAGNNTDNADTHFALSPPLSGDDMRIVLTWDDDPGDLDSHLWLPEATPYHVCFSNQGSTTGEPFAALDVDDTDQFGPETITISQFKNGTYVYAVHNWSDDRGGSSTPITASAAKVQVYQGANEDPIATLDVPASGDGFWWNVLQINVTDGVPTIAPVNSVGGNPAPYWPTGAGLCESPAGPPPTAGG